MPTSVRNAALLDMSEIRQVVAALDLLGQLAQRDGLRLSVEYTALRRALASTIQATVQFASAPAEVMELDHSQTRWCTTYAAAIRIGCTRNNIRDLIRRNRLIGHKIRDRWMVDVNSVTEYIERNTH